MIKNVEGEVQEMLRVYLSILEDVRKRKASSPQEDQERDMHLAKMLRMHHQQALLNIEAVQNFETGQ